MIRSTIAYGALAFGVLVALCAALIVLEGCVVPQCRPELPPYCYNAKLFRDAHEACPRVSATREASEACGLALDRSCGAASP